MTFEEANELRGNIDYGEGREFSVNCQSCVVANELRRRGYDVTALPNLKKQGTFLMNSLEKLTGPGLIRKRCRHLRRNRQVDNMYLDLILKARLSLN